MQVIVQVVTDRDDRFVLAEEERLRELAALTPGTPALKEERTRAFWALTTPTAVRNLLSHDLHGRRHRYHRGSPS
jgi:hypothetical protein